MNRKVVSFSWRYNLRTLRFYYEQMFDYHSKRVIVGICAACDIYFLSEPYGSSTSHLHEIRHCAPLRFLILFLPNDCFTIDW